MTVRDELLTAAARVYAEAGYRGATTRRIALAAGVNEITLFRHFGSKDALLREALTRNQDSPGAELPEDPKDPLGAQDASVGFVRNVRKTFPGVPADIFPKPSH